MIILIIQVIIVVVPIIGRVSITSQTIYFFDYMLDQVFVIELYQLSIPSLLRVHIINIIVQGHHLIMITFSFNLLPNLNYLSTLLIDQDSL